MRGRPDEATPGPDSELRDELQGMEARVRKMRNTRNSFSDQARTVADKRNSIQGQYKEHREKIDLVLTEMKAIRAEIKMFKEKRNALQQQLRDIISQAKGRREEKGEKRSATAEYAKLQHEVQSLENTFETSSVGQKKEKEMIKRIKEMKIRIEELAPEVTHFEMIKVDLSDLDSAIKTLRAEADAAHQEMLGAVARADVLSPEVDEAFAHRDFLKAEGDRLHNEFLELRQKSDEMHNKITELMVDVNKVRDKLNMARDERKSWMTDHNASVKAEMKTGAESVDVADELVSTLLNSGGITFGGIGEGDNAPSGKRKAKSGKKKSMRKIDMNANRRR
ncbi:MAG: hypothetical protein CBC59_001655 [Euryarchaeota archaeon TMED99]|nr:MAG: hypothetical protein CBC59_001655 [Euryarchaeota archaeon TMED99]